jgi:hypothetical protein
MVPPSFGEHDSGIRIGRADDKVCHAPIATMCDLSLWMSYLLDPVMPLLIGPGQVLSHALFQAERKWDGS